MCVFSFINPHFTFKKSDPLEWVGCSGEPTRSATDMNAPVVLQPSNLLTKGYSIRRWQDTPLEESLQQSNMQRLFELFGHISQSQHFTYLSVYVIKRPWYEIVWVYFDTITKKVTFQDKNSLSVNPPQLPKLKQATLFQGLREH